MNTQQLKQKILDLAIKGQLVAQDSQDEPAAVLLERIRAEKQELIKAKKIKKDKNASYITRDTIPYQQYTEHFADGTTKDITDQIPFDIPQNWAWCRLGEVCSIKGGKRLPKGYTFLDIPTDYIYIRVADMKNNTISKENLKYIDIETHNKIKNYLINKDDLYLTIAGTIGNVGVIPDELDGMNLTENAAKLTSIQISKLYLMYALLSSYCQEQFQSSYHQVAQPKLSLETANKTLFPLPPLSEQQRIVAKVEELLALVETIDTNKTDLATYIQQTKAKVLDMAIRGELVPQNPDDEPASVLLERIRNEQQSAKSKKRNTTHNTHYDNDKLLMVNDEFPLEIPENWAWCRLGEVCEFENGFAFNSNDYKKEEGIPLIRISNIQNGTINLDEVVLIDKKIDEKFIVKKGDLLIAMSGATTGKMGNYTFKEKAYLNQRVGNIRIRNKDVLHSKYRDFFMLTKSNDILKMAYGGAQPNISGKMINSLSIPLPPLSEQKRIVQKIKEIFTELDTIEENLT